MKSVRSRCYFAYDPKTGEVFKDLVVVKPQDLIRMSDNGPIPKEILDQVPHDTGIGWSGRTVVLRRTTHELPASVSVSGEEDSVSLHDRSILDSDNKSELLERLDELDPEHGMSKRNSLKKLREKLKSLLGE